jgi:hypothetical protein
VPNRCHAETALWSALYKLLILLKKLVGAPGLEPGTR